MFFCFGKKSKHLRRSFELEGPLQLKKVIPPPPTLRCKKHEAIPPYTSTESIFETWRRLDPKCPVKKVLNLPNPSSFLGVSPPYCYLTKGTHRSCCMYYTMEFLIFILKHSICIPNSSNTPRCMSPTALQIAQGTITLALAHT